MVRGMKPSPLSSAPVALLALLSLPAHAAGLDSGPWVQRVTPTEAWVLRVINEEEEELAPPGDAIH